LEPLDASAFNTFQELLDTRGLRHEPALQWEFCEGFMAALICCRRPMQPDEYLPVLLSRDGARQPLEELFEQPAQLQGFLHLWARRWDAVTQALDRKVTALDDPGAYQPQVLDTRAAFGQLWALGFMAAVNAWPEEWAGPRNKAAQHWRSTTLDLLQALTQGDTDPPTQSAFADDEGGPPTVSARRMRAFGDAIWAVYNMRDTWRQLGPRLQTVHAQAAPGRNDPCHCGSGKKFKKCCGGG
jgi:uncharacterized protein